MRFLPGLALASAVALAAALLAAAETALFGRAWIEPMVLAILLGALLAYLVRLPAATGPGIDLSMKTLLDIAVALLGATLSWAAVTALGWSLFLAIAALVAVALVAVYWLGRTLGLAPRLALLIAVGNAICGNSAIAAVAPIVGARREEVTAAITLTALIGVVTVLLLPLTVLVLDMEPARYALLTGLSVYAVPQVVAAAAPFGTAVIALATLVKLARVVMLGPLTLALSLLAPRFADPGERPAGRPRLYLPWFIIAFAAFAALRSAGVIDDALAARIGAWSKALATIAMAALGLGVRLSVLREAARPVSLASAGAALILLVLAFAAASVITPPPIA